MHAARHLLLLRNMVVAVEEDAWQDLPLGLDPRVLDLLGNSIALNTTATVRQEDGQRLNPNLFAMHL